MVKQKVLEDVISILAGDNESILYENSKIKELGFGKLVKALMKYPATLTIDVVFSKEDIGKVEVRLVYNKYYGENEGINEDYLKSISVKLQETVLENIPKEVLDKVELIIVIEFRLKELTRLPYHTVYYKESKPLETYGGLMTLIVPEGTSEDDLNKQTVLI